MQGELTEARWIHQGHDILHDNSWSRYGCYNHSVLYVLYVKSIDKYHKLLELKLHKQRHKWAIYSSSVNEETLALTISASERMTSAWSFASLKRRHVCIFSSLSHVPQLTFPILHILLNSRGYERWHVAPMSPPYVLVAAELWFVVPVPAAASPFPKPGKPPFSPSSSQGVTGPGLPNGTSLGLCGCACGMCILAAIAACSTISLWYCCSFRLIS